MIKTINAVYKKNRAIVTRAYPWSFIISRISGGIFSLILPIILFYFVFNKNLSVEMKSSIQGMNYITYIITGEILSILSFSILMNVGRCLITEIREGTLDTFLLSPASRMGYYIGTYLEQFVRSLLECISVLIVGLILGARISINKIPLIICVIIFSSIAFFSLAILISSIMVFTRDTYLVQNTFYLIMHCICGVIFPLEYLPKSIQLLSNLFPLTPAIKLFRICITGRVDFGNIVFQIVQLIVLSVIYIVVGYIGFRKMETKLIEEVLA